MCNPLHYAQIDLYKLNGKSLQSCSDPETEGKKEYYMVTSIFQYSGNCFVPFQDR